MAILIDQLLTATPSQVGLPSGPITLRQTLSSDLTGGESVTITYSLALSHNVSFQTPDGGVKKQIQSEVKITSGTPVTQTIKLVETGGGTNIAQVTIKELIDGEENNVRGSVVIAIQQ